MISKPIRCELYDYIEVACSFRYPVLLSLDDGEALTGKPIDTLTKADNKEYLIFMPDNCAEATEVPMDKLVWMQSLIENPHFSKLNFRPE